MRRRPSGRWPSRRTGVAWQSSKLSGSLADSCGLVPGACRAETDLQRGPWPRRVPILALKYQSSLDQRGTYSDPCTSIHKAKVRPDENEGPCGSSTKSRGLDHNPRLRLQECRGKIARRRRHQESNKALSPIQAEREFFSSFSLVGVPSQQVPAVSPAAQEPTRAKTPRPMTLRNHLTPGARVLR